MSETIELEQLCEGGAHFTYKKGSVFFNPTQVYNRDFSVAVIATYLQQRKQEILENTKPEEVEKVRFRVLDALSATGLRAIRYATEIPANTPIDVIANDMMEDAVETIQKNIVECPPKAPHRIFACQSDCNILMQDVARCDYSRVNGLRKAFDVLLDRQIDTCNQEEESEESNNKIPPKAGFDVIDLDPYGHPTPFLDAAISSLNDGGLLCCTATDGLVTCGKQQAECFIRYQAASTDGPWGHEGSIRLVLNSIGQAAARQRRYMEPLLSFFHGHYLRVFVLIKSKPKINAKKFFTQIGTVYHCPRCKFHWISQFAELRNPTTPQPDYGNLICRSNAPGTHCPICPKLVFANSEEVISKRQKRKMAKAIFNSKREIGSKSDENKVEKEKEEETETTTGEENSISQAINDVLLEKEVPMNHRKSIRKAISSKNIQPTQLHTSGPIYTDRMHSASFLDKLLEVAPKITPTLKSLSDINSFVPYAKAENDLPALYYSVPDITSAFKLPTVSNLRIAMMLESLGYLVGPAHTSSTAIKTNAPPEVILQILKLWWNICNALPQDVTKLTRPCVYPAASFESVKDLALYKQDAKNIFSNVFGATCKKQKGTESTEEEINEFKKLSDTCYKALKDSGIFIVENDASVIPPEEGAEEINSFQKVEDTVCICNIPFKKIHEISAFKWFGKYFYDEKGVKHEHVTGMFMPNPEKNWGPKKAAPVKKQ